MNFKILILSLMLCSAFQIYAQDTIQIKFRDEMRDVKIGNKFLLSIKHNGKLLKSQVINGKVVVDKSIRDSFKFVDIEFKYKRYKLSFEQIASGKLNGILKFGIDKPPFNADNMNAVFDTTSYKFKYIIYVVHVPENFELRSTRMSKGY